MSLLKDGAGSLAGGLVQGADEISGTTPGEETIDMFASPVNAEETMITTVENNGHAMAPYMMSVGLWVGCLARLVGQQSIRTVSGCCAPGAASDLPAPRS